MQLSCPRATQGSDLRVGILSSWLRAPLLCYVFTPICHPFLFLRDEPCQACDFEKCVPLCRWLRSWSCWASSSKSDPATKFGGPVPCMARRHAGAGVFRPTLRGTFTGAFDVARQVTTSISTQLPRTSPCSPLRSTCVLVLDATSRGSTRPEPDDASILLVANLTRGTTRSGPPANRENGPLSKRDQQPVG